MTISECLAVIAPWYNLILVVLVLLIFRKLFSIHFNIHHIKTFTKPWKLLMYAVLVFVLETVITILRSAGIGNFPFFLNGVFELIIIGLFIYMLFIQREHVKAVYQK
tara:strand:- start:3670 stop:3990 length:321 start_codon:yes stop_codon:yes gene_type:complete